MIKLITKPLEGVAWLFGLAFPMFSAKAAGADVANPQGRWVARVVLVLFGLTGLFLINQLKIIGIPNWIHRYPMIGKVWLPLFGLGVYVLLWLGWWLYRVLSQDVGPEQSEFPDIDHAWAQAMDALNRNEIQLDATPLFLVLGWTSGSEEAFFHAGGIRAKVKQVPQDRSEPLHVTADRDGIWVTCPGISLLSQQNPALRGGSVGGGGHGQ